MIERCNGMKVLQRESRLILQMSLVTLWSTLTHILSRVLLMHEGVSVSERGEMVKVLCCRSRGRSGLVDYTSHCCVRVCHRSLFVHTPTQAS